jgi:cytochrome P450
MLAELISSGVISWSIVLSLLTTILFRSLVSAIRNFRPSALPSTSYTSRIPGPWYTEVAPFWFHWQRWNGRLTTRADDLLRDYGDGVLVRLHPNIVLVNDLDTIEPLFKRKDVKTGTEVVRSLEVAGHRWTINLPQFDKVRSRRAAVQAATNPQSMRQLQPTIEENIKEMLIEMTVMGQGGKIPVDIFRYLRMLALRNGIEVLCGRQLTKEELKQIDMDETMNIMCAFNDLVAWRVCLPQLAVELLDKLSSFAAANNRPANFLLALMPTTWSSAIRSSARLHAAAERVRAVPAPGPAALVRALEAEGLSDGLLTAEVAGTLLAATETTSTTATFALFELSLRPALAGRLLAELRGAGPRLDAAPTPLLDGCVGEALRFRGPVALTSSRVVPAGGYAAPRGGWFLPGGTVVVVHNSSLSRHGAGGVERPDEFEPGRWAAGADGEDGGQRLSAPFGFGIRRCPGSAMGFLTARLMVASVVRGFRMECPPETSEGTMRPVERNGFRPEKDECRLILTPRVEDEGGTLSKA